MEPPCSFVHVLELWVADRHSSMTTAPCLCTPPIREMSSREGRKANNQFPSIDNTSSPPLPFDSDKGASVVAADGADGNGALVVDVAPGGVC